MASVKNLPVSLQDQQSINRYSYLIYRSNRTGRALEQAKTSTGNQRDALDELDTLELEGDESNDGTSSTIPVQAGTGFFHLPLGLARQQAEKVLDMASADMARLQKEHDAMKRELASLKKALEAKFGDAIRLE